MARQVGMFDIEERLAGLSKKGDDLERLGAVVDFELFRPELERAVPRADRSKGGRPPFEHVMMFKVLILQIQNNLSDERTEFYLRDRLTWMRFLGLGLGDPVPDANTIWTFREALTKAGAMARLFELVDLAIPEFGYQNHISADRRHRLIRRRRVTDAAAHAGAHLADLLDPDNTASEWHEVALWPRPQHRSCHPGAACDNANAPPFQWHGYGPTPSPRPKDHGE